MSITPLLEVLKDHRKPNFLSSVAFFSSSDVSLQKFTSNPQDKMLKRSKLKFILDQEKKYFDSSVKKPPAIHSSVNTIVYGPVTETLHPPGDFWRPLFLEILPIGLLKSGCLQKSQCWIKPWGRFFSKWPPNFNKMSCFWYYFLYFDNFHSV